MAQLRKAQKTGPFLGPHFGAGKPLSSSFLESQNLAQVEKYRPPVLRKMQLDNSKVKHPITASLEHTFDFNGHIENLLRVV